MIDDKSRADAYRKVNEAMHKRAEEGIKGMAIACLINLGLVVYAIWLAGGFND